MKPSPRDTPSQRFWHRPYSVESGANWHLYEHGASLCGTYILMGLGRPKDARVRTPKKDKCGQCLRKTRLV